MNVSRLLIAGVVASACSAEPTIAQQKSPQTPGDAAIERGERKTSTDPDVNPHAATMKDFQARVDKYIELHKIAARDIGRVKESTDPTEIKAAQDVLAARIQGLRADAKQGDILTPQISGRFRQLLAPELKGEDGRDAKTVLKDDAPPSAAVPFKVNAKYPEGQPLPTVPASLLINLPPLPEPLEYRIIGKHLILLDTKANIIADFMTNAIS